MKLLQGRARLSASDLSNHLACGHVTSLDYAVATGRRSSPAWSAPDAWVLQQRGLAHESAYIDHLKLQGLAVADLRDVGDERASFARTEEAMRTGVDVIVQAVLATFRRKNEQSEADRALRPKSGIDKVLLSEAFS